MLAHAQFEDLARSFEESIMIVRITWGRVKSGQWNEFERAYRTAAEAKNVKGLKSRWLCQDTRDRDGGFTITLWETEQAMADYEKTEAFQQLLLAVQPFFIDEYKSYTCDLKFSK
jgi:heme-degrading monooxygenase HmoA